jgi:hypothetical protein
MFIITVIKYFSTKALIKERINIKSIKKLIINIAFLSILVFCVFDLLYTQ